ncbi:hypothetical protein [Nocardioides sp.]|uniref:hypothetical protein n=1 Tax=Nocardioides sp. TaxID=35761 RepID=UPI0039E3F5B2
MSQTEPDDEDAAWREIVENFGDRAELPTDEVAEDVEPVFGDDVDEDVWQDEEESDEFEPGGFVPPDPEPIRLTPARTLAWGGVLGAPVLALLTVVVSESSEVTVPGWWGLLLILGFLGGFGYLVATMPRERDDPWDDGARL